jgi:hypothetical protein
MPTSTVPPSSTTLPTARPIRVLVVGDSVATDLGNRLATRLSSIGPAGSVVTTIDTRPATGLSRPDAYDWPARLATDLTRDRPGVVVAMWGANDAQAMPLPSGPAAFGSPAWDAAYASRVMSVVEECREAGALLDWVGEPVMRSGLFDARMQHLDQIVRSVVVGRPDVMFSDVRPVLATPIGGYTDALPGAGGSLVLVRATDGIHLTWDGADRLAAFEVSQLRQWLDAAT